MESKTQAEQVEELINALGALSEMLRAFTDDLTEQNFTEKEIMEYCKELIRCTCVKNYGRPTDVS